jgi:hypothetical protein
MKKITKGTRIRVQSMTSGRWLNASVIKVSLFRRLLCLPHIKCIYLGSSLNGPAIRDCWVKTEGKDFHYVGNNPSRHLSDCPFCGCSDGDVMIDHENSCVGCAQCGVWTLAHSDIDMAVGVWNRRSTIKEFS